MKAYMTIPKAKLWERMEKLAVQTCMNAMVTWLAKPATEL